MKVVVTDLTAYRISIPKKQDFNTIRLGWCGRRELNPGPRRSSDLLSPWKADVLDQARLRPLNRLMKYYLLKTLLLGSGGALALI